MPENHDHSLFVPVQNHYDGHRRDINDLDLAAYVDAKIAAAIAANPGGGAIQSLTVEITDAQFKSLDSTPITIIPAPGSGKAIMLMAWAIVKKFSAGAYGGSGAGSNGLQMYIDGTSNIFSTEIVVQASAATNNLYYDTNKETGEWGFAAPIIENKAIELWSNLSNDMTGGNAANTLNVTVYYAVVDL